MPGGLSLPLSLMRLKLWIERGGKFRMILLIAISYQC